MQIMKARKRIEEMPKKWKRASKIPKSKN